MLSKKLLLPLWYFLLLWVVFILGWNLQIIEWAVLSSNLIVYLTLVVLIVCFTYVISVDIYSGKYKKAYHKRDFPHKHVYFVMNLFIFLSIISLALFFYIKSNIGWSVSGITEARYDNMYNVSRDKSSFNAIISLAISGFPVALMVFSYWYKDIISKVKYKTSAVLYLIYILTTMLSGGRNGAFISLLIILVMRIYTVSHFNKLNYKKNISIKIKYTAVIVVTLVVFSTITLERQLLSGREVLDFVPYLESYYDISFNTGLVQFIDNSPFSTIYALILRLYYYAFHSLGQFDVILNAQLESSPYYGALTFYAPVKLLNILGFDIITIEQILLQLPNPGTYSTLFGSMYLDFGFIGSLMILMFLTVVYSKNYVKYYYHKKFINFLALIPLTLIFILSPIYSFIELGGVISILIAFTLLVFLVKVFKLH
jgi:oligosaccharide repeat unit polymerase